MALKTTTQQVRDDGYTYYVIGGSGGTSGGSAGLSIVTVQNLSERDKLTSADIGTFCFVKNDVDGWGIYFKLVSGWKKLAGELTTSQVAADIKAYVDQSIEQFNTTIRGYINSIQAKLERDMAALSARIDVIAASQHSHSNKAIIDDLTRGVINLSHGHDNANVLEKIGVGTDGSLMYDGQKIEGGTITAEGLDGVEALSDASSQHDISYEFNKLLGVLRNAFGFGPLNPDAPDNPEQQLGNIYVIKDDNTKFFIGAYKDDSGEWQFKYRNIIGAVNNGGDKRMQKVAEGRYEMIVPVTDSDETFTIAFNCGSEPYSWTITPEGKPNKLYGEDLMITRISEFPTTPVFDDPNDIGSIIIPVKPPDPITPGGDISGDFDV